MKEPVTRLDYCQYLLVTQINYRLTHFAEPTERFSHDAINRYLRGERITPRRVWDNVRDQVVPTPQGYIVFDDTVLDKNYSSAIEVVRRQYRGNAKAVIKDRLERTGMHWTVPGAQALLQLRCVALNDDWEAFLNHYIDQETARLYPHANLVEPAEWPLLKAA